MNETAAKPDAAPAEQSAETAPPRFAWSEALGRLGAVTAIVAAWLFLAGWSYIYNYLGGFGIGIHAVSVDTRQIPIWGWLSVREFPIRTVIAAAILFALGASANRLRLPTEITLALTAAGVALAFVLALVLGRAAAREAQTAFQASQWRNLPVARIHLRPSYAGEDPVLDAVARSLADGCQRLLFQDQRSIYLIRPVIRTDAEGNLHVSGDDTVTALATSDVALLRLGPTGQPPCRAD